MKTALQEAFTELEKLHPSLFDIYTEKGREFVNNFHKFLELEKQQIIEKLYAENAELVEKHNAEIAEMQIKNKNLETQMEEYKIKYAEKLIERHIIVDKVKYAVENYLK